jgi:uncharacterized SAM-binding protein YcdF (DUF218 family)
MLRWIERVLAAFGFLIILLIIVLFATYETVPTHNGNLTHFDTIIVLGSPVLLSGQPSPEERERVTEAVKEFKAGRAGHMIFTGGAAENNFVESRVMARLAVAEGVPADDIVTEGQSQNTIQNLYFSNQIMEQKGWTSAEVVSSPSHLPRAGLILEHYHFQWMEHAAHWPPEYSRQWIATTYAEEMAETMKLRWHGFPPTPFLPVP